MIARMNGFVIVECIIDRTGVVRDVKVVKSSSELFEQGTLDAVQSGSLRRARCTASRWTRFST